MQTMLQNGMRYGERDAEVRAAWQPSGWRVGLLAGCAVALAAVALTAPAPTTVEPDLLLLLRGMAALKAAMVAGLVALLWWRLQWPMSAVRAGAAFVACWALCAATVLIWQMERVGLAAGLFHVALLGLLLLAWHDDRPRRDRPTPT